MRLMSAFFAACLVLSAQAPALTTGSLDFRVSTVTTGKPVAEASVTFQGPDLKTYSGKTAADGHFRQADLPPGVYKFSAFDAPGYVPYDRNFLADFTIHAGHTTVFGFEVNNSHTFQGTVTAEDGKPIAGATVVLIPTARFKSGRPLLMNPVSAVTDAQGAYFLTPSIEPSSFLGLGALASGVSLTLKAYLPPERALQTGQTYFPGVWEAPSAGATAFRPGKTDRVDFTLHPTPTFHIRGRVASIPASAENPIVWISDCSGTPEELLNTSTSLKSDGSFDATGVLPGYYCVVFAMTDKSTQTKRLSRTQWVKVSDRDIDQVELAPPPPLL